MSGHFNEQSAPWVCGRCYFLNKGKRRTCAECGAERPRRPLELGVRRIGVLHSQSLGPQALTQSELLGRLARLYRLQDEGKGVAGLIGELEQTLFEEVEEGR